MTWYSLYPRCRFSDTLAAELYRSWHRNRFEPRRCQNDLERLAERVGLQEGFDGSAVSSGGHFATPSVLHDAYDYDAWVFRAIYDGLGVACDLDQRSVPAFGQLVLAWSSRDPDFPAMWSSVFGHRPPPGPDSNQDAGRWPEHRGPCLIRREHASIIADSGQTRVMTDPQCLTRSFTTNDGRFPAESGPGVVDAICITHSHEDHFSLPSIIRHCHEDTLVIVPPVERSNLLAADMLRCCELVGLDAIAPKWGDVVSVGDIEIEVLPFFGEQPTRTSQTTAHGVRNWGSCYRFNLPTFSAVVLADSGEDPEGVIYDALRASVARSGPADVLLSCFAEFPEKLNLGLASYMVTQPFAELKKTHDERTRGCRAESITFGPTGVAEACRAAEVQTVLPYAHGFAGLGVSPRDEARHAASVAQAISEAAVSTELRSWRPGGCFRVSH